MLEGLQERLARVTKTLRGEGHLTEYHIDTALREIRLALLEADVSVEVVAGFVERVRARALGREVLSSVTPAQMVTKIVHDELVGLLGGSTTELDLRGRPAVVMLVGLQGSGKTTTAAKLAQMLREQGHQVHNPSETAGGDTTLPTAYYMRASLGALLNAEGVVLLPGGQGSANCKTELRVALALGLAVFSLESNIPAWALGREELDD